MSSQRLLLHGAVYVLFQKANKILLLRRFNTGWMDGYYTLPSGHLDPDETVAEAAAREALEETGISTHYKDLKVVLTIHQVIEENHIDFYLTSKKWTGTPKITEPDECDDLQWFSLDKLPPNLLPNVREALKLIREGVTFSEFWGETGKRG